MKCARQYVYKKYLHSFSSDHHWCSCDLSSYHEYVRKLIVGEILIKFGLVYQVDPKIDRGKKRTYYVNAILINTDERIRGYDLNHIIIPLVKYHRVRRWHRPWSGKKTTTSN